ncbi:MAG: Ig-like domain repeat protein [Bradyrhizobium sp.]
MRIWGFLSKRCGFATLAWLRLLAQTAARSKARESRTAGRTSAARVFAAAFAVAVSGYAAPASAAAPTISLSFSPANIALNATSSLTFTIINSDAGTTLTGVGFTNTLPAGVTVPTANTATCGGTLATGGSSISLSGATIAPSGQCQFSMTVTGTTSGTKVNTTGVVTSDQGAGNQNSAILYVAWPPSILATLSPSTVGLGLTSSLTFALSNPNPFFALTGVAFTDNLPAGVEFEPAGPTGACGGTVTRTSGSMSLSGAALAANSQCQFSMTVVATSIGDKINTTTVVTSTEGGAGNSASVTLSVTASPPGLTSSFSPSSITVNQTSSLTFTLTNGNPGTSLTGVGFTDNLPAGSQFQAGTANVCGGTVTRTTNSMSLSGAIIAASGQCQFSVTVTGTTTGDKINTTGAVTSNEGGNGGTTTAVLGVFPIYPPILSSSFTPSSINVGQISSLAFRIANINATSLTDVGFNDNLPAGLQVQAGTVSVCGGTLTRTTSSISLAGATIAPGGQCQFDLAATATSAGTKINTTGAVTSIEGGSGNYSTATLTVGAVASTSTALVSSLNPSQAGQMVTFTATVTSSGGTPTGSVSFLDNATVLGTAPLSGGVAVFSISTLATGSHPIRASYQPGPGFLASTSAVLVQTVNTPTDSLRLRAMQLLATPAAAQVSGQAFSGSVQSAISEGFGGGGPLVAPNSSGIRFNFAADADGHTQAAVPRATAPPSSSVEGSRVPGAVRPASASSRVTDAMSALAYAAPPVPTVATAREWFGWAEIRGAVLDRWNTSFAAPNASVLYGSQVNLLAGLTYRMMPNFLIGALGGYETFDYRSDTLLGRLRGDGWTVGAYLGWMITNEIRFDVAAGYSGIGYNGAAGLAAGNFSGNRWLVASGLTGTYDAFGLRFEPSARVYALWERENAYTDTLGTLQAARNFSTGRASGGMKVMYPIAWTATATLTPYAGLYGDYYFNTDDAAPVIGLAGLPGGLVFDGFSARAVGGLSATLGGGAQVSVGFERSGLGGDFALWGYRAAASVPFGAQ